MILQLVVPREELIKNGVRDQENELKKLPIKDGNHAKCMLDVWGYAIVNSHLTNLKSFDRLVLT